MNKSPSKAPVPKVIAATGGSGLGGAIGVIIVWILQQNGLEVTNEVGIAIGTVCSVVLTFVAGYLTPPNG